MKKNPFHQGVLFTGILFFALLACRKQKEELINMPPLNPGDTSSTLPKAVDKDSILYYTRDLYLWDNQIPASFKVNSFAGPEEIMNSIRSYSIEPGFSTPVDRWSFAMKKTEWDDLSSGLNLLQENSTVAGDFGMTVFFRLEGDLRVSLVEPNSPAGRAGIRRGWRINKVNGSSNISTTNASFLIKNIYESTASSITFNKPDGSQQTISLSAAKYQEQPVYLDSVYSISGKKIGYLVFNSFLGEQKKIAGQFQRVFSQFAAKGVNTVVIDLRYNGGGYVSLQEILANYLVNAQGNGKLMMKSLYNSNNSQHNETTYFKKAGSLNLNNIYFIVGSATASASELLINNLKPHLDVKLVGPGRTHGKPVGFFPVPVGDWYIFPVSFRTVNSHGEGNYFNGLPVNGQVADGLDNDWGNTNESCLASVIRHITTGRFTPSGMASEKISSPEVQTANALLDQHFLKVAIGNRK